MGIDLIIAMAASAMIVRGWEKSKRRSAAAWAEARHRAEERGAARQRARQERSEAWQQRLDDAKATGPRNPLWWAYATGWIVAAATAALTAGVAGAVTGAISGARGGYKVGRAGLRLRWTYRETWTQWRTHREWIETERCERCGGYVPVDQVVLVDEHGRVCPDCVPTPSFERSSTPDEDEPTERAEAGDRSRRSREHTRTWTAGQSPRCVECGTTATEPGWVLCVLCARLRHERRKKQREHEQRSATEDTKASGQDDSRPSRIYVNAERADVQEETRPKEITTMSELVPANGGSDLAGTGEGYTDTVSTLATLAKLLNRAHEEVQNLGDMLTANSLDSETLGQINELADALDSAAPMADGLHKHVESRHAPVADAVAGAGGSGNIAAKSWYDQY
ncbi:hypothetical protein FHX42_002656 [Saccharopolyspora lacisalsi]|uniref:Uncharacterized protein n=1 Tax=Halosaccharopolyspora lacisalsi TaxID=1000566 RepID=A0A839E0V4_9PSEU|nr:hypothetical protein [Halosaccharopolyspora lacisalsi]MBA8825305.1 hypothetical protein [Halosaccharopolyspora lacisalsi]